MGLESVGSIEHIEVEGRAIREPFGGTRTLNRKPQVTKPRVATNSEDYEVVRDKDLGRTGSQITDVQP